MLQCFIFPAFFILQGLHFILLCYRTLTCTMMRQTLQLWQGLPISMKNQDRLDYTFSVIFFYICVRSFFQQNNLSYYLGSLHERPRCTESCAVIGYLGWQGRTILPPWDYPFVSYKKLYCFPYNKSFITKLVRSRWPGRFCPLLVFCTFMDPPKQELAPYPAILTLHSTRGQ